MILDAILLGIAVAVLGALFVPRVRNSEAWRATVTPLASIIGSGFLVVAPLLGHAVGVWAPVAMAGIVMFAYAIGAVSRFNIIHLEPVLKRDVRVRYLERSSNIVLSLAYLISVAFYVRLLVSFALRPIDMEMASWVAPAATTAVLAGIGALGVIRGMHGLEWLEQAAVNIKLGIIAALIVGLGWFDLGWLGRGEGLQMHAVEDEVTVLRLLAGMLLVVQGFETSRYLGSAYDAGTRVRSMRRAQWLSAAIYVLFVSLALPLLGRIGEPPSETAIIGISQQVAPVLPVMLLVAAVMSQLSAALADTAGSGGMVAEFTGGRVPEPVAYLLVIVAAIVLVWAVQIFSIIAIASRAFALYYLLQCTAALLAAGAVERPQMRLALRTGFAALAVILALVVVFAIPAESP